MKCQICHEPISKVGDTWTHYHGDVSCGTGDGSTAYPSFSSFSPYAWIIDQDHLFNPAWDGVTNEAGTVGPHNAAGNTKNQLAKEYQHHHQFRMYDDDGELYYTGTLFWNGDANDPCGNEDDYVYGPLRDFGMPNAGAVLIKYTGKPEWDCG